MNFTLPGSPTAFSVPGAAQVRVAVMVIARDDQGRIVLQRTGPTAPWQVPGGRLEAGESVEQAASRIFAERTGIKIRVTYLRGIYSDPEERMVRDPDTDELVQEVNILLEAHLLHQPFSSSGSRENGVGFFPAERLPSPLAARSVAPLRNFLHGHVGVIR